jgi:thymidylate kinase
MVHPLIAGQINGILLEGGEYSGKTSVATELEKILSKKGMKVKRGHAVLHRFPVIMMLNKEAFRSLPKHIPLSFPDKNFFKRFNGFRTAQLMVDLTLAHDSKVSRDEVFLIQDRHWYSQKFMNQFFTPGLLEAETQWMEDHKIEFKYKIYLTCSHKVRLQRSKKFPKYDAFATLDKYFLFHVQKVDIFDKFCMDSIQKEGGWIIIDTSDKKPLEIAQAILDQIHLS